MLDKHNVLISYSKEDQSLAEKVLHALSSGGISCWAAFQNLEAGDFWPAAITEAISKCDIFVLILTQHSNTSRQVVRELTQADNLNKKLYCFQTEDVLISPNIQYFFSAVHRYEAFKIDFGTSLKKMTSDIARQLGEIPKDTEATDQKQSTQAAHLPTRQVTRRRQMLIRIAIGIAALLVLATLLIRDWTMSEAMTNANSSLSKAHQQSPNDSLIPAKKTAPFDSGQGLPHTHKFDSSDFQLSVTLENHFAFKEFVIDDLDLGRDFVITFEIKSTRKGGSTRYGIAWNFTADDFLLFTIHSTGSGYYTIGAGRSRSYAPFSRFAEGYVNINGESDFDILELKKRGDELIFVINSQELWRTSNYKLLSNRFAFWVADFSDALIRGYTVFQ